MKSSRLSDVVTGKIREDITKKKYKPGEKIPAEPELMKYYGVGRSTIREAIKSLSMSGIVKVQQGSGTFVNEAGPIKAINQRLQSADFEEVNAVRKLLEAEIVKLAVLNHQAIHIEEMKKSLTKRKDAIHNEDREACMNADIDFHTAIAKASMNSVLAGLYQSFTLTIRSFFLKREAQGVGHFAISHHLHEALFEAIKNKKANKAQQVIQEILTNNY